MLSAFFDKRRSAFTLIELLVVISIIALLLSILMPALSKVKEQAKLIVCNHQIRQILLAEQLYAQDNNDRLPPINFSQMYDAYGIPMPPMNNFGPTVWTEAISPYIPQAQKGQEDFYLTCPNFEKKHPGIDDTDGTPYGQLGAADNNHDRAISTIPSGPDLFPGMTLKLLRVKQASSVVFISESYWHPWTPDKTAWMISGPVNPDNWRAFPELRHSDRFPVGLLDGHAETFKAVTHPETEANPPMGIAGPIYWPNIPDSGWLTW
jgi:prepilin-type N-terminal cleavage/methylation domain-containing protein/prepilin-type processing-associated H-X9-DG protein